MVESEVLFPFKVWIHFQLLCLPFDDSIQYSYRLLAYFILYSYLCRLLKPPVLWPFFFFSWYNSVWSRINQQSPMWCHVAFGDCCTASTVWQPFLAALSPGKVIHDPDICGRKTREREKLSRSTASISRNELFDPWNSLTSPKLKIIDVLIAHVDWSRRQPTYLHFKTLASEENCQYFSLPRVLLLLQFGRSPNAENVNTSLGHWGRIIFDLVSFFMTNRRYFVLVNIRVDNISLANVYLRQTILTFLDFEMRVYFACSSGYGVFSRHPRTDAYRYI